MNHLLCGGKKSLERKATCSGCWLDEALLRCISCSPIISTPEFGRVSLDDERARTGKGRKSVVASMLNTSLPRTDGFMSRAWHSSGDMIYICAECKSVVCCSLCGLHRWTYSKTTASATFLLCTRLLQGSLSLFFFFCRRCSLCQTGTSSPQAALPAGF